MLIGNSAGRVAARALADRVSAEYEAPAQPQEQVTLYASGDATIKSWAPTSNFGNDTALEVSYSSIDVAPGSLRTAPLRPLDHPRERDH